MITISLSFLSLGTNKYSGKCILGQPETLSFQNFLGEHAPDPHRRAQKYFSPFRGSKHFLATPLSKTRRGPCHTNIVCKSCTSLELIFMLLDNCVNCNEKNEIKRGCPKSAKLITLAIVSQQN